MKKNFLLVNPNAFTENHEAFEKLSKSIELLLGTLKPSHKSIQKYLETARSISEDQLKVIDFTISPRIRKEILEDCLRISNQTKNHTTHIQPLVDKGLIEPTIKNIPNSKHQRYFTTPAGKVVSYILNENLLEGGN